MKSGVILAPYHRGLGRPQCLRPHWGGHADQVAPGQAWPDRWSAHRPGARRGWI